LITQALRAEDSSLEKPRALQHSKRSGAFHKKTGGFFPWRWATLRVRRGNQNSAEEATRLKFKKRGGREGDAYEKAACTWCNFKGYHTLLGKNIMRLQKAEKDQKGQEAECDMQAWQIEDWRTFSKPFL